MSDDGLYNDDGIDPETPGQLKRHAGLHVLQVLIFIAVITILIIGLRIFMSAQQ